MLEDLEEELWKYEAVGEFLTDLKKEFGGGDEKIVKVAKLKRLEQDGRMMEEFIQKFRRAARDSRYKERPLVEEFKRGMNEIIHQRLMESEQQPTSIEQWYDRMIALDRNWKESRIKEERLRGR